MKTFSRQEIQNFKLKGDFYFVFHEKPHIYCKLSEDTDIIFNFALNELKRLLDPRLYRYANYKAQEIPKLINYIKTINKEGLSAFSTDISNFFYNICHIKLLNTLKFDGCSESLLILIEKILHFTDTKFQIDESFVKEKQIAPNHGVPIGHEIFFYLASYYLKNIDDIILSSSSFKYYFRYIDDMLLYVKDIDESDIVCTLNKGLFPLSLMINKEKSKFYPNCENLTFLKDSV